MVKATPSWKGAPLVEDKDAGWSFKPRGRIQYDVGYVVQSRTTGSSPATSASTPARAASASARKAPSRAASATSSKWTIANGAVGFGDAILTYAPKNIPLSFAIGNQETNNGLEQISSSRFSSFVERAAFDDAFINTRRIGLNIGYANTAGDLRLNAGLFAAHSIDSSLDNDGWIARDARGLLAADGRQPAALRRQFPAPRVPVEQWRDRRCVGRAAFDQPAGALSRPSVHPADRPALRRHRQLRRRERQYHRPRSGGHLQVAARRGRGPVSEGQRL